MDTNGVTIKDGANEATKLTKDGFANQRWW